MLEKLRASGLPFEQSAGEANRISDSLEGKKFVVSGQFTRSREEIKKLIETHGGKVLSTVSANLDFLLAGEKTGPAKMQKASKTGIPVISETDFLKMIGKCLPQAHFLKQKNQIVYLNYDSQDFRHPAFYRYERQKQNLVRKQLAPALRDILQFLPDHRQKLPCWTPSNTAATVPILNVAAMLNGRDLDYLVILHMEPDHAGMIGELLQRYPSTTVVTNARALKLLDIYFPCVDKSRQGSQRGFP